jgi:tetratricopeptide (TPR) repeat protein
MKKNILAIFLMFILAIASAQTKPATKQKPPASSGMDKQMEDAMQGMSEEDKAEMQKMMKSMMPDMTEPVGRIASYPEFSSNNELVPKKDVARINAIPKKKLSKADVSGYASNLYNKLLAKGDASEMAMTKKVLAQSPKANDIGRAAILCMEQGHEQAAMALSMKAVIADPTNPNWQNNMASMLTQYGYPEQAIPVLKKLQNEFPSNSTVLNNLGQAWFGLGDVDSAKAIIRIAGRLNPYHPEAEQTEGVIDETSGDPSKATEEYVESMENSLNPFTEQLMKNNNGQSNLDNLDFEKLKRSITIYEFFPKDWIEIPTLSDNVSGYGNDMRIKNGYRKMFEDLESRIEQLNEAAQDELNTSLDKGQEAFIGEMKDEMVKGLSLLSKPAILVQNALQKYLDTWQKNYRKEHDELMKKLDDVREGITKSGKEDKCVDRDQKNDEYLDFANPLIREFHARKIEEFRTWLNAYCTWTWYIAGNPKNTVIIACLGWTEAFEKMYQLAIDEQNAESPSCAHQSGDGFKLIITPEIPNFSCPTIIKIPLGSDLQNLSSATTNFDNNKNAVTKAGENPVPNHTVAYGADHTSIAEPGPDPFFKAANGSITPGISETGNSPGEQLLDILTNGPQTEAGITGSSGNGAKPTGNNSQAATEGSKSLDAMNQGITDFWSNYARNKIAQQKQLAASEKEMSDFWSNYTKNKIAEYKNASQVSQETTDFFTNYAKDRAAKSKALKEAEERRNTEWFKELLKSKIEYSKTDEYKRAMEEATTATINKLQRSKRMQELLRKFMTSDCSKIKTTDQNKLDKYLRDLEAAGDNDVSYDIKTNGLQPSISSGIQAPGTFAPINGLFK